uniref:Line l1 all n=1 Tax=Rhipicephalus appendiculatus TaxID=34631 RepID=A0A131YD76_RHIAP
MTQQDRVQASVWIGHPAMDHSYVINQIMENSLEYSKSLDMAFIDYEKAFDMVEIPAVVEALHCQGILDTLGNTSNHSYLASPQNQQKNSD